MTEEVASMLGFTISVLFIWIGIFWFYRDYSVDVFRQKMFALRDRLFDYAMEGNIEFKHPAYCILRRTMNGYLRFGHKISAFEMLLNFILLKRPGEKAPSFSFANKWKEATRNLKEKELKDLEKFRVDMGKLIIFQALLGSPIFLFLVVLPSLFCIATFVTVIALTKKVSVKAKLKSTLDENVREPLGSLESAALAYGSS